MVEFASASRCVLRRATLTALVATTCLAAASDAASARYYRHAHAYRARVAVVFHARGRSWQPRFQGAIRHASGGSPAFSAYAVDGNSGRVLYGVDENAPRHPASITKVMTLYLLFEQIEKGHISLDTRIEVSPHAASQSPTKLGLRPGSTIRVEDAIKAIVTESANDMAVAVAEKVGGDEDSFARLMTRKAHALGMSRTAFVNASGLPDDRQITTARDLSVLGRAIHDHYPRYFRYFSTPSFNYAGRHMANHNHLMEQVEGMDGIKTGYTRSSGFNLLSSVNRNGHWLVSVVLGGRTRLGRDKIMADLIEAQIDKCATSRTAPMIAENPALEHMAEAVPVVRHEGDTAPPVEGVDDENAQEPSEAAQERSEARGERRRVEQDEQPEAVVAPPRSKPSPRPVTPAQSAARIVKAVADVPTPRARPAFVTGMARSDRDMTTTGSIRRRGERFDGTTSRYAGAATATPSTLKHRPQRERAEASSETPVPMPKRVRVAALETDTPVPTGRPASRGGVMIQIGATPTLEQANELIARAKSESRGALAGARPFTEKVQKGGGALYRARFTGLGPNAAETACRNLKRAGLACFATRN